MRLLKICSSAFCNKLKETRKMIVPQSFTSSPLQQYFHVVSQNYDFLLNDNPGCSEIYVHSSDSPSSLLRKNAIHIFPDSVPTQNVQEKYKAFIRKLQKDYEKSFSSCKAPAEVFHLQRRIKTQVRQRCRLIGKISGKYRHYNLFKSINQLNSERTMEQYKKNGIQVTLLGKNKIYPQGPVWLPTNDTYLKLLEKYLAENTSPRSNILDLGCGSGVLSFILGKQYKSAKIWAVDSNNHAVQTCKVNAATLGIKNIEAFQCDIIKIDDFQHKCRLNKCPPHFDLLISNPPWLIGKRGQHQSQILDGVYDNKGNFLNSTFKIANKFLSKEKDPRFILIYSDLSKNLGLQKKSIQQHCKQNNFLIKSVLQAQYPKEISKQSALAPYKLKSKVMLYQISRS